MSSKKGSRQMSKKKKLTENQRRLLSELPDDKYKFPGSRESQSYAKLESMGYAVSELMVAKRNVAKGTTEFRPAYKRTEAGRAFAAAANEVQLEFDFNQ